LLPEKSDDTPLPQGIDGYQDKTGYEYRYISHVSNIRIFFPARKVGNQRFVEVKGTTGDGNTVIMTANEVQHARDFTEESALVLIAGIESLAKW
jgi:hypothetical protein